MNDQSNDQVQSKSTIQDAINAIDNWNKEWSDDEQTKNDKRRNNRFNGNHQRDD